MTTAGQGIGLAWLLDNVRTLDAGPAPLGRAHRLQLPGMRQDHEWKQHGWTAKLPATDEGLELIRETVEQRVLALDDASPQAWAALLNKPAAVVQLRSPVDPAQCGFYPPSAEPTQLQFVGLAVVVQKNAPEFNSRGLLTGVRFAGVGRLLIVNQPGKHSKPSWAQLKAAWYPDALRTLTALQQLQTLKTASVTPPGLPRVYVLGGHDQLPDCDGLANRIRYAGSVLGYDVRWLPRFLHTADQSRKTVTAEKPEMLLCWQTGDRSDAANEREVLALRREAVRGAVVRTISAEDGTALLDGLRDALMLDGGFGHGLHRTVPALRPSEPKLILPPIGGRILEHSNRRKYYEDPADGTYWSHDDAGHGGSEWKQYRQTAGELEHLACCDHAGNPIPKHKGPAGERIPLKHLHTISGE